MIISTPSRLVSCVCRQLKCLRSRQQDKIDDFSLSIKQFLFCRTQSFHDRGQPNDSPTKNEGEKYAGAKNTQEKEQR